ncbi:hypothetical protein LY76DRAFT_111576 [Colletotrichum caudatum]|nr:hypothetical protein LY76DRAFT_111576 [Colletotrichum caudatum]
MKIFQNNHLTQAWIQACRSARFNTAKNGEPIILTTHACCRTPVTSQVVPGKPKSRDMCLKGIENQIRVIRGHRPPHPAPDEARESPQQGNRPSTKSWNHLKLLGNLGWCLGSQVAGSLRRINILNRQCEQ